MVDEKIIFDKDKVSNKFKCEDVINNYKIIKYMGIVPSKHSYHNYWKCKCDCGNVVNIREEHLLRGVTMYCNKCKGRNLTEINNKNKVLNYYEFLDDYIVGYDKKKNRFLISKESYDYIKNKYWYLGDTGYFYCSEYIKETQKTNNFTMHSYLTGFKMTDHINRDKTDNRLQNLRESNHCDNAINKRKRGNKTTGLVGVIKLKGGKYQSIITKNKIRYNLGTFVDIEDAKIARRNAEIELFGDLLYENIGLTD